MDILSQTNWKEALQQTEMYRLHIDLIESEDNKTKQKELKSTLPPRPALNLRKEELLGLDLAIAELSKPVQNSETGLYSPSATLATIKDERLKDYIKYVALEIARSNLYTGSAKENTRWVSLVPIFMAAHKEYNNIKYEQWDKKDKYLWFILGKNLYSDIKKWAGVPLSDTLRKVCRMNALKTPNGKEVAPTAWPRHNIKIDSSNILKPFSLFRHMWLQTWMANVELRNEFMILDVNNWDFQPEALDAVFKPEVITNIRIEEDAPW